MTIRNLALATVAAVALPLAASAATIFNVTAPVDQPGIADGGVYGTTLTFGDIASVDVVTAVDGDSDGVLGFMITPVPARSTMSVVFNTFEAGLYGSMDVYLSTSMSTADAVASGTVGGAGDLVTISGDFAASPFYVILDWTTEADNDFSFDVQISAVPVPAAGGLLLGALGLLGLRRRKS